IRQPDVDDERVRRRCCDTVEELRAARDGLRLEALLAQAAPEQLTQLGVVLCDQDVGLAHSSRSIAPSRKRRIPDAASAAEARPPSSAAPASAARNPQGAARWSGGGANTCWSIATSIS